MNDKLDNDREKRLARTGKWFAGSVSDNKDIYLTYIMPLLLLISLCITVFVALS